MKLLIADDELQIRSGLAEAVDWASLGIDTVLTAENGVDALGRCRVQQPEILITDIRMPGLDGLTLSRQVMALYQPVKIIVLSGYSEFSYAQEALKIGVFDYLLKPVDLEELQDKVVKCREALLAQAKDQQLRRAYTKFHWQQQAAKFLKTPRLLTQEEAALLRQALPGGQEQVGVVAVVSVDDVGTARLSEAVNMVIAAIGTLEEQGTLVLFQMPRGAALYVPAFLAVRMEQELRAWHAALCRQLAKLQTSVTVALSDVGTVSLAAILLEQARLGLQHRMYRGGGSVILWNQVKTADSLDGGKQPPLAELTECLRLMQPTRADRLVEQYFDDLAQCRIMSPRQLQSACESMIELVRAALRRSAAGGETVETPPEFVTVVACCAWVRQCYADAFVCLKTRSDRICSREVVRATEYIAAHYRENLTLEDVAREVDKSKNYFSSLFKREMGISFVDYLTKVRIQAAEQLLERTDLLTYQVAEAVGFRDYRYFSTVFKKLTGHSPASHRRQQP